MSTSAPPGNLMKSMNPGTALAAGDGVPSKGKQIAALTFLNLFVLLVSPYILAKKISRIGRKRSRHELDWRRWFIPVQNVPLAKGNGPRIVLMGPTFGELRLIEAMDKRLRAHRPDANIIWCIRDLPTIELAKANHPDQPIVISPFENIFPVLKWAGIVKPDVLVILEKFWMPNLLAVCKMRGARIAVINGRTNRRDRLSDKLKAGYYRWVSANVDTFCLQEDMFLKRMEGLIRPSSSVLVTGNMKLDLALASLEPERQASLESWLSTAGETPILAAGSTGGPVDEEFVLDAFLAARAKSPCCLMIAPRKLHRAPEVVKEAEARGLRVSLRSAPASGPADVYVLDTMGELATAYKYCKAAFIGGTILATGHNVIEPLYWGVPVSYGPKRGHFEDLQRLCEKFKVGFRCFSADDLSQHWQKVLTDPAFGQSIRVLAQEMLSHERGATDKTVEAVLKLV